MTAIVVGAVLATLSIGTGGLLLALAYRVATVDSALIMVLPLLLIMGTVPMALLVLAGGRRR